MRKIVGRASDCDVVISSPHVSKHHCALSVKSGICYIEDLNSTNGTYVDGKKIHSGVPLSSRSIVKLGNEKFDWQSHVDVTLMQPVEDRTILINGTASVREDSGKYKTRQPLIDIPSSININRNDAEVYRNGDDGADWKVPLKRNMGDKVGDYVGSTVGCLLSVIIILAFLGLIGLFL